MDKLKMVTTSMLSDFKRRHDEAFDAENIQTEIDKVLEKEGFLTEEFVREHFYDKDTVNRMISDLDHAKLEVVDELPDTAIDPHAIYLIQNGDSNSYNQYLYLEDLQRWINLGSTDIDLSNYYTTTQMDAKLKELSDEVNVIAGEQGGTIILDDDVTADSHNGVKSSGIYSFIDKHISDAFGDAGLDQYVTNDDVVKLVEDKTDDALITALADYYDKEASDRKFALKTDIKPADLSDYNTKTEIDKKIEDAKKELSEQLKNGTTTEVVSQLPTQDISTSTIYLIKDPDSNLYIQWMYISGAWYSLGSTELDLSGYAKETDLESYAKKDDLGSINLSADEGNILERRTDGYYVNAIQSGGVNITQSDISKAKFNLISLKPDGLYAEGVSEEMLTELDMSVFPTHEQVEDFNTLTGQKYEQWEQDCVTKMGEFNIVKTDIENWGKSYKDNLDAEEYIKKNDLVELDMAVFPTHEQVEAFNETIGKKFEDWEKNTGDKLAEYNQIKNDIESYTQTYQKRLEDEEYVKKQDLEYLDLDYFPNAQKVEEFNTLTNERYAQFELDAQARIQSCDDIKAGMETWGTDFRKNLTDEAYVKKEDLEYLDLDYFPNSEKVEEFNNLVTTRYQQYDEYCNTKQGEIEIYCNTYKQNLDAEKYVKYDDLYPIDITELFDRIEALEEKVRILEGGGA